MKKRKKQIVICITSVLLIIILFILKYGVGQINNVNIQTDDTSNFYSEQDMKSAINAIKLNFFILKGGYILTDLWYDQDYSYPIVEEMKEDGIIENTEDAIVFLSNFTKKNVKSDNDWEKYYQWTVIKNNKTGSWKIDYSRCGVG